MATSWTRTIDCAHPAVPAAFCATAVAPGDRPGSRRWLLPAPPWSVRRSSTAKPDHLVLTDPERQRILRALTTLL